MNTLNHSIVVSTTKQLMSRGIKTRYVESILGFLWLIAYPLSLSLITFAVFSFIFSHSPNNQPYILHLLIGYSVWIFFQRTTGSSATLLLDNRSLITNTRIPFTSLITSHVLIKTIDLLVALTFCIIMTLIINHRLNWTIVLLPIVVFLQVFFQIAISFIGSLLNVLYRDIQYILDIGLQLLFYMTPIIYPLSFLPNEVRSVVMLNPLAVIIELYRYCITGSPVSMGHVLYVLFIIGISIITSYLLTTRIKSRVIRNI